MSDHIEQQEKQGLHENAALVARFFDGQSSKAHTVSLKISDENISFIANGITHSWPVQDIEKYSDDDNPNLILGSLKLAPDARLVISDQQLMADIEKRFPQFEENYKKQNKMGGKVVAYAMAAAACLILIGIWGVPFAAERFAPFVPASVEQRLGKATRGQIVGIFTLNKGADICEAEAGAQALRKMVAQIEPTQNLHVPLNIIVIKSPIANAFALPGGYMVIMSDILKKMKSSDELAAVIAHEMGHIKHRHSMKMLMSSLGYSFIFSTLLGDFTGATVILGASQELTQASYTRDKEYEADREAGKSLQSLNRDPSVLGDFLLRLDPSKNKQNVLSLLRSHPYSEQRMAALKLYTPKQIGDKLISDKEWNALKNICGQLAPFTNDANLLN